MEREMDFSKMVLEKGEEETKWKYSLIISQYYFSRHMFIVHHEKDFIKQAQDFAKELMLYKRDEGNQRELFLGDLDGKYALDRDGEIRRRYNINDSGDIYFIQSDYANYCAHVWQKYREDSLREKRGFQKKVITESIAQHHDYEKVKYILEKYFEIA